MMQKIIVPTDFSPTATAALRYAYTLADATGCGLEVIHVHDGYGHAAEAGAQKESMEVSVAVQRSIDQFIRFARIGTPVLAAGGTEEEVFVSSREVVGSPVDVLLAASKEEATTMIVMGGVGSGVVSTVTPMFGSVARSVVEKADCPVLLVPKDFDRPAVSCASIAFDNVAELRQISDGFTSIRKSLWPAMRLVHVRDFSEREEARKELDLMEEKLSNGFPDYAVELDLLDPGITAFRLLEYVDENNVDLLVMGRQKRNFIQRLFVNSEASQVIDHGVIPMLFIPVEK